MSVNAAVQNDSFSVTASVVQWRSVKIHDVSVKTTQSGIEMNLLAWTER